MGLATLLGLDERPGEISGWGPILPAQVRRLVDDAHHGEWRIAITDAEGYLLRALLTRRRPGNRQRPADPPSVRRSMARPVVEIAVPESLLIRLNAEPDLVPSRWRDVVAAVAGVGRDDLTALDAHPDRRFAHAGLRRHIEIRDRTCVAPGCRHPARTAQLDHSIDYAAGGPTTSANSGPLCPRHHTMKSEGVWRLRQPQPGVFTWRSSLGQHYRTRGEPVSPPLPDPIRPPASRDSPANSAGRDPTGRDPAGSGAAGRDPTGDDPPF